jgi:DNA-binding NtrC family response regulator
MDPAPPNERSPLPVLFVSTDGQEVERMQAMLADAGYRGETLADVAHLPDRLSRGAPLAVILDLDSLTLDNPTMRRLSQRFPDVCYFCSSRASYHPELQEAIRLHFFACLPRPLDPEELAYWLRCAGEHAGGTRAPP